MGIVGPAQKSHAAAAICGPPWARRSGPNGQHRIAQCSATPGAAAVEVAAPSLRAQPGAHHRDERCPAGFPPCARASDDRRRCCCCSDDGSMRRRTRSRSRAQIGAANERGTNSDKAWRSWMAHLVQGVPAFWHDMGLLSGQPEAEAEGLEADGALVLVVGGVVAGDDG